MRFNNTPDTVEVTFDNPILAAVLSMALMIALKGASIWVLHKYIGPKMEAAVTKAAYKKHLRIDPEKF